MRAMRILFVAVAALILWAGASYADVTVNPSSGPPGTVVTVSGITACPGPAQPELWFSKADRTHPGDLVRVPFLPPSPVTFVVPDVPAGDYLITPNCGAMEAFYAFVVTPGFTG